MEFENTSHYAINFDKHVIVAWCFRPFCANMFSDLSDVIRRYSGKMRHTDWKIYFYSRDNNKDGSEKQRVIDLLKNDFRHCDVYCFAQKNGWLKYDFGVFEPVFEEQEEEDQQESESE